MVMPEDSQALDKLNAELRREIEERVRTEKTLKESEERFLKAFHASPAAQTIATLPEGRWLEVNDSFLRMLEYTRPEVIVWKGKKYRVPKVLLGGDHKKIEAWRKRNRQAD